MKKAWITTGEAMRLTGMTRQGVITAAKEGRLPCQRVGDFWLIDRHAAERYEKAKAGRKKSQE